MSSIFGNIMFNDNAFYDIIWILLFIVWFYCGTGGGGICGNGNVYICLEVHISLVFFYKLLGRKENLYINFCKLGGSGH